MAGSLSISRQPQAQGVRNEVLEVLVSNITKEFYRRFKKRIQGSSLPEEEHSDSSTLYPPPNLLLPVAEPIPGNHLQHEIADTEQAVLKNTNYINQEFKVDMGFGFL
jgi:hypothetical protein